MESLLKLLIVDDESRFLKAISQRLKLRGFSVQTAENGQDALALSRKERFDVALLDLKMPGMDGSQVLKALKAQDPLIEAIILTGHGSLQSAVGLADLGAFCFLPKPYELDKLVRTLVDAYAARLRREFAADAGALSQIEVMVKEDDPLKVLRKLRVLKTTQGAGAK